MIDSSGKMLHMYLSFHRRFSQYTNFALEPHAFSFQKCPLYVCVVRLYLSCTVHVDIRVLN